MGRGGEREERRERERKGGEEGRDGEREGEVGREREGKEEQIGVETVLYRIHYQQ